MIDHNALSLTLLTMEGRGGGDTLCQRKILLFVVGASEILRKKKFSANLSKFWD